MEISLATLSSSAVYHVMTQTIIPRPIAWVLSQNRDGSDNLAPFSYFNAVCSDPPLMMLSVGKKPSGQAKDTVTNLTVGKYCVVHIAHADQADIVSNTAASLDYGDSEIAANNIQLIEQSNWPLARISDAPVAYLCKVHSTQTIGNTPQQLIFVEAICVYVQDECASEDKGRLTVNAKRLDPLARLGANQYATLGTVFNKNRPK